MYRRYLYGETGWRERVQVVVLLVGLILWSAVVVCSHSKTLKARAERDAAIEESAAWKRTAAHWQQKAECGL